MTEPRRGTNNDGLTPRQQRLSVVAALLCWGSGWVSPDVLAERALNISRSDGLVIISWSNTVAGVQLQGSSSLDVPVRWTNFGSSQEASGAESRITISNTADRGFYRLVSPLNHVLIVGQSLAIGAYANVILSPSQPFANRMFVGQRLDGGQPGLPPDDLSALAPLVESWEPIQQAGETIASGFANWISSRVGIGKHDLLVSNSARGGAGYVELQRLPSGLPAQIPTGTGPYLRSLKQVEAAKRLLQDSGYLFRAILAVHGERDLFNPAYDRNIRQWQEDYETDIQRLTGQTNRVPMFHSQISSWGNIRGNWPRYSPFKVLEEFEVNPGKTVLVCPKYMLPHRFDGLHLTNVGYRWLGEYYGKAYYRQVILGEQWSPLRPAGIQRTNNVITIRFAGVVGGLVFDTNSVANPLGEILDNTGSPTDGPAFVIVGPYGFEYWDEVGSGSPWTCSTTISSVELVGADQVSITLSQVPPGKQRFIRYGYTALGASLGGRGGPELGPRGCLRDADPTPSLCGNALHNWCVHFNKTCP